MPWGLLLLIILVLGFLSSCLGVNADIALNNDNSGTISLEYRISGLFDSLGKLDGSEGRPPLPVGRIDMERTIERLPGMKLLSYSSKDDKNDRIISARLQFADMETLLAFLDAAGEKAVYANAGGKQKLTFTLGKGLHNMNPDLKSLIDQISSGYRFGIKMNFNSPGTAALLDTDGRTIQGLADIQSPGKTVSCSVPMGEILAAEKGLILEFQW